MPKPDLLSDKAKPVALELLIVDDDKIIHLLHSRVIELCRTGHPVSAHVNGSKALEYIVQHNKPKKFFLVLLDLNMPVMNGWEFLEECQNRGLNNIIVVIVTSSTNSADRMRSFDFTQVIAICEKPFTKNKMMEILELKELKPFSSSTV